MSRLISVDIKRAETANIPVSLCEMKEWLKLDPDIEEDDSLIEKLILSALDRIEHYVGLVLADSHITAMYQKGGYGYDSGYGIFEISYGPVTTESMEANGFVGTEISPYLHTFSDSLTLTYDSSWGSRGVPEWAKEAIKTEVAYRYENRGDELVPELSADTMLILAPFRNTLREFLL